MNNFESMSEKNKIMFYYREQFNCKLLTAEQEIALGERIRDYDDYEARELLFSSNFRLVLSLAEEYQNCGVSLEDLFQEGIQALWKATEKFDPSMGCKFSTFATKQIKGAMLDLIYAMGKSNRISKDDYKNHRIIVTATEAFENQHHRNPSIAELSQITNLSEKVIKANIRVFESANSIYLDKSVNDEDDSTIGDFIPSNIASPYAEAEEGLECAAFERAVNKLPAREREFFAKKNGMFNYEPMELTKIAEEAGITYERVRQIVKSAEKKLAQDEELRAAVQLGGDNY